MNSTKKYQYFKANLLFGIPWDIVDLKENIVNKNTETKSLYSLSFNILCKLEFTISNSKMLKGIYFNCLQRYKGFKIRRTVDCEQLAENVLIRERHLN